MSRRTACSMIAFSLVGWPAWSMPSPPATPIRNVVDKYHDTKVTDSYRWLEKTEDPEVQKWTKQQTDLTREFLDGLPHLSDFQKTLTKWNRLA